MYVERRLDTQFKKSEELADAKIIVKFVICMSSLTIKEYIDNVGYISR